MPVKKVICPICGRKFRTRQGLRGHLNFKHGLCRQTEAVRAIGYLIERAKRKRLEEAERLEELRRETEELKRLKTERVIALAKKLMQQDEEERRLEELRKEFWLTPLPTDDEPRDLHSGQEDALNVEVKELEWK